MDSSKILEILISYNQFWNSGKISAGISRDLLQVCFKLLDRPEVLVLKGIRRSGKSTLLAQIINKLMEQGINPRNILRINLDEPLFSSDSSMDLLENIYRIYRERVNPEGRCWLFLDEIQEISGWERWVRGRLETENIRICVTGSSSNILSREIGTKLTGRNISIEVFPLSFKEFLRFHGHEISEEIAYLSKKPVIRRLFEDYLTYGGFPEVVLMESIEEKKLLLRQYFEDLVYRDIVSRKDIRDVSNLKRLVVYLLTNTGRLTSISKLKNNFSISQDKTENYVSAILESYLIYELKAFSYSLKKSMRTGFKPYAIDTGIRNRIAFTYSDDRGWIVENIVALSLLMAHEEIFFFKKGNEIDFILSKGQKVIKRIQVWYEDIMITKIPDREIASLLKDQVNGTESILITNDYEDEIINGSIKIRCIPIIKFLLNLY